MFIEFQLLVLIFMRDWYQMTALNNTGETREALKKRGDAVQSLIDRLTLPIGGDE